MQIPCADNNPDDNKEEPDGDALNFVPVMEDFRVALEYIKFLKNASLDSEIEPTSEDLRDQIRNPPQHVLTLDNPNHRLPLDIFLVIGNASEKSYDSICTGIHMCYPESELLTYYKVKRLVAELSSVSPIEHDMCINLCLGYTGPLANAESCMHCGEPRYEPSNDREVYVHIPTGILLTVQII